MQPGISIQVTWPMAAQEAILSEFSRIEPPHLLMAVLKLAELEERQFEKILQDRSLLKHLISERDDVRAKLTGYAVDIPQKSRKIRYGLRKNLGRGGHPYDGQAMIHRSDTARDICRTAEKLARQAGSLAWCADHLLDALIASPETVIRETLQPAGLLVTKSIRKTPFLDQVGIDLNASISNLKNLSKREIETDPVIRVLSEETKRPDRVNLLLIQKGRRSAREVVAGLGASLDTGNKRFIELNLKKVISSDSQKLGRSPSRLINDLFDEAIGAANVLFFITELNALFSAEREKGFARVFRELLTRKQLIVIAATDAETYDNIIKGDAGWRKLFRPVWIHDLKLPRKL